MESLLSRLPIIVYYCRRRRAQILPRSSEPLIWRYPVFPVISCSLASASGSSGTCCWVPHPRLFVYASGTAAADLNSRYFSKDGPLVPSLELCACVSLCSTPGWASSVSALGCGFRNHRRRILLPMDPFLFLFTALDDELSDLYVIRLPLNL